MTTHDEAAAQLADEQRDIEAQQERLVKFWSDLGFRVEGTGGGCRALFKRDYDKAHPERYICVTMQDDADLPSSVSDPHDVGIYEHDEHHNAVVRHSPYAQAAQVLTLARLFCYELEDEIGRDKVRKAAKLNKAETSRDVCHSHDFCDANMSMLAAWNKFGLPEMDMNNDAHMTLWNDAWHVAVLNDLNPRARNPY